MKTSFGNIDVVTPRDRDSSFQPVILPKRETTLGNTLDNKIISLYSKGMSYTDIRSHMEELYGIKVSPATITGITDKIVEEVELWQNRELESVYPFIWLDALHYKVRENKRIVLKAVYCVIGVNREGIKDLLGLYVGEQEGSGYWLKVLNDLKQRGVRDVFIACIDNLKGFAEAIEATFPETKVQLCVVHQIRNSLRKVAYKDKKEVATDLKLIYQAHKKDTAAKALNDLDLKWAKKYPAMVNGWLNNWERLTNFFDYPKEIRKVMYTTNIIESFNSQLRKITKTKRVFASDMALYKLLYLAYNNMNNLGTRPIAEWGLIYNQLFIIFEDRIMKP